MTKLFTWIVSTGVFLFWMHLVGNPHVIETIIGLIIAGIVWVFLYLKLKKINLR